MTKVSHQLEDGLQVIVHAIGGLFAGVILLASACSLGAAFGRLVLENRIGMAAPVVLLLEVTLFLGASLGVGLVMTGGGAQLMRALPASGRDTLAYLAHQDLKVRVFGALFVSGLTLGTMSGTLSGALSVAHPSPELTLLVVPLTGMLFYQMTSWSAWAFVLLSGRRAASLVGVGFTSVALVIMTLILLPDMERRFLHAGAYQAAARYMPSHWPIEACLAAFRGEPGVAAGWAALAVVTLVGLRALVLHLLGDRLRRATASDAGAGPSPHRSDALVVPDLTPRATPALPVPVWIALRTAGLHADALPGRLMRFLLFWVLIVLPAAWWFPFEAIFHGVDRREPVLLWFLGGMILSMGTAVRFHAAAVMQEETTRLFRWGRMYPSWAMLPVGPYRTAALRGLALSGVAVVTLCVTAPFCLFAAPSSKASLTERVLILAVGLLVFAAALLITNVNAVLAGSLPARWRATHPVLRVLAPLFGALAIFTGLSVVFQSQGPGWFGILCVSIGGLGVLRQIWVIDRRCGNDVIEPPQSRDRGPGR